MNHDPISLILFLFVLSALPIIFILTTSFIKISMVCILTRESLGVQAVPPNIVIYALSIILTLYVMGPVYNKSYLSISDDLANNSEQMTAGKLINDFQLSVIPIKEFLSKHARPTEKEFFYKSMGQYWTKDMMAHVKRDDLIILIPAFMITELNQAFKIGFLIYLPSLIIDIIVSNILMAMGMMMMSPVTISLPIKLLLFISIDGWSRLIHVILGTY